MTRRAAPSSSAPAGCQPQAWRLGLHYGSEKPKGAASSDCLAVLITYVAGGRGAQSAQVCWVCSPTTPREEGTSSLGYTASGWEALYAGASLRPKAPHFPHDLHGPRVY